MEKKTLFFALIFVSFFSIGSIPIPEKKIGIDFSKEILKENISSEYKPPENKEVPDHFSHIFKNDQGELVWAIFFPEDPAYISYGWKSEMVPDSQTGIVIQPEFSEEDQIYVYFLKIDVSKIQEKKFTVYFSYPLWDSDSKKILTIEIEKE